MKIGIILEPYEEVNASGIALCILNQMEGLSSISDEDKFIVYSSRPLDKKRTRKNIKNIIIPKSFLGKEIRLIKDYFLNKEVPDVILFNMPLLPIVLPKKIKTIPVFYELIYQSPSGLSLKRRVFILLQKLLTKIVIKRSPVIITPSKSIKKDIVSHYNIDSDKIKPIYIGFQEFIPSISKKIVDKPYFIFLGKIKYKKNIHNMVDGFIRFKKEKSTNHKFILLGDYNDKDKYFREIRDKIEINNLGTDILFFGYVNNKDEIYNYYINSGGLVFATLQEGFGMPIIEAMRLSVPVITSSRAPMNEVSGGAAFLVDPEEPESIKNAFIDIVENKDKVEKMKNKGLEWSKNFSWDLHNKELFKIIKSYEK